MNPEMAAARIGKMTASKAAVVMSKIGPRGGMTDGLCDYIESLAFEQVFGDPDEDSFRSKAMERGNDFEPGALNWYAFTTDTSPELGEKVFDHPTVRRVAATPDGRLPDRVIEAKCLLHKAWMYADKSREIPSQYRWQVRWQQWVCGVRLCDFVVWHPKPGGFVIQNSVTDAEIEQMMERAIYVNIKIDERVEELLDRRKAA